jgi:hypothetical protein
VVNPLDLFACVAGFWCETCAAAGEPLVPQRDSMLLLHWLRNPHLQMSPAWSRILTLTEALEIAKPGSRAHGAPSPMEDDLVSERPLTVDGRSASSRAPRAMESKEEGGGLADLFTDRSKLRQLRQALLQDARETRRSAASGTVAGRLMPWEASIRDQKYETKAPSAPVVSSETMCGRSKMVPSQSYSPRVAKSVARKSVSPRRSPRHRAADDDNPAPLFSPVRRGASRGRRPRRAGPAKEDMLYDDYYVDEDPEDYSAAASLRYHRPQSAAAPRIGSGYR